MLTKSLIHVFKVINDKCVITNEVGTAADCTNWVVKPNASAKAVKSAPAPKAVLELA